jgi:putative tricarboxylic transport membrane protein
MTKKAFDFVFVGAMMALSLYVGITANRYPKADITEGFGPGIYPILLAGVIFLLSVILLVITIRKKGNEKVEGFDLASLKRPVAFWGLLLLYCLAMKPLGLLLSSFLYLAITTRFLFRVRWRTVILTSVLVPAVVWAVFVLAVNVPFPTGTVWNLFR